MMEDRSLIARVRRHLPAPGHYLLFLRINAWLIAAPILTRLLSLPRLMALVTPRPRRPPAPDFKLDQYARHIFLYMGAIIALNRKNLGKNCLRRSIVLYRFLRLAGIPARIFMGVKKVDGQLTGHAWVEVEGKKIQDPLADQTYAVTFAYPPAQ